MMTILKKITLISFAAVILLVGIFTVAQSAEAAPWQLVPACGAEKGGCNVCDAIEVGINITKIMLGTLGSAALLMFVYGGVLMAISRGHTDQVTKGKDALTNAVKGVIIVLASWVVINYGLAMMLGKTDDLKNVSLFNQNWATVACGTKITTKGSCNNKYVGDICEAGRVCDNSGTCVVDCKEDLSKEGYECIDASNIDQADYVCKPQGSYCPMSPDSFQCCKRFNLGG